MVGRRLGADWQRSLITVLTCARIGASDYPSDFKDLRDLKGLRDFSDKTLGVTLGTLRTFFLGRVEP